MHFKFGLDFQWKRAECGSEPRKEDEEALKMSALRQAAFDILKGEADGEMTDAVLNEGEAIDYVGTWKIEGEWSSRRNL